MKTEKNSRAMLLTFIVHSIFISGALFPIISMVTSEDEMLDTNIHFIEIAFEDGEMSPSTASTKPFKEVRVETEKVQSTETVKTENKQERVEQKTNSEIDDINGVESDMNKGDNNQMDNNQVDNEERKVGEVISEKNETEGSLNGSGEGEIGPEITGSALANMEFEGEGVFGRKIIYHANISSLAEEEGRVVVNLCINRSGRVTHVAFNKIESTLAESEYVKQVMKVTTKYRFEADYMAPLTQCGKLSFIFRFK